MNFSANRAGVRSHDSTLQGQQQVCEKAVGACLRSTCSQEPSYQPPVGPGDAAADSPDAIDRTAIRSPSLKG